MLFIDNKKIWVIAASLVSLIYLFGFGVGQVFASNSFFEIHKRVSDEISHVINVDWDFLDKDAYSATDRTLILVAATSSSMTASFLNNSGGSSGVVYSTLSIYPGGTIGRATWIKDTCGTQPYYGDYTNLSSSTAILANIYDTNGNVVSVSEWENQGKADLYFYAFDNGACNFNTSVSQLVSDPEAYPFDYDGPAPTSYISLLFPSDQLTLNSASFNRFGFSFERATSSYTSTFLQMRVASSTAGLDNCPAFNAGSGILNNCFYTSATYPVGTTTEAITDNAFWPFVLSSSTYYGRVLMYDYESGYNFIAQDGDVEFYISATSTGFETYLPEPTAPEFTDSDFGKLGNLIVDGLKWLFLPSQGVFDYWNDIADAVSEKPPVGYFSLVKTQFENIDENATSTYELPELSEISFFSTLRTIMITMIWFAFAFFLFNRIKHLEL